MTFIEKILVLMIALIVVFIAIAYICYSNYSQDNHKTKTSLGIYVLALEILETLAIVLLIVDKYV